MAQYYNPLTGAMQDTPVPATAPAADAGAQSLVSTPAQANVAAAPTLDALSQMVNRINRQAQTSMIPGGEQMEQQSAQNIANLLSGQLPTSFTQNLQSSLAQQYGARGFAPDTAAMNAAALRAMGLESQALQSKGEQELSAAYARHPIYDISQSLLTPSAYASYQAQQAEAAARAASLAEQRREFDAEMAYKREFPGGAAGASAAIEAQTQLEIARMNQQATQNALNEKIREFDRTQSAETAREINQLREQARQANMEVGLNTQRLNAQVWNTALQYMDPRTAAVTAANAATLPNYVSINTQMPQLIGGWR